MRNINIAHIIKTSDSKFLKSLPGFAIRIIARIIRQTELNQIIDTYSAYEGVDLLSKLIEAL